MATYPLDIPFWPQQSQYIKQASVPFNLRVCVHFRNNLFRVALKCSTIPSVWGWHGEVLICLIPVMLQYFFITLDIKIDPLSVNNSCGTQILAVTSIRQFIMVSVVTFLNAKASGHLVAKTIKTGIYLILALVLFYGPSTSKAILVKGSIITGC